MWTPIQCPGSHRGIIGIDIGHTAALTAGITHIHVSEVITEGTMSIGMLDPVIAVQNIR